MSEDKATKKTAAPKAQTAAGEATEYLAKAAELLRNSQSKNAESYVFVADKLDHWRRQIERLEQ